MKLSRSLSAQMKVWLAGDVETWLIMLWNVTVIEDSTSLSVNIFERF